MTENKTARLLCDVYWGEAEEDCQETPEEFLKSRRVYQNSRI